jgi:carboxymethylenebutenolidase
MQWIGGRREKSMDTFRAGNRAIPIERFQPANPGPNPTVLVLHGADGLPGRGMPYRELAARFAVQGYCTYLPHYFEATDGHTRPDPLNPINFAAWMGVIHEAIHYVLRQPETVTDQVALIGFSLGGYLAVTVGTQNARVGAIVECCGGVADFFVQGLETMPPVLILHGGADPVVPVSEAYRLEKLLKERGRPYEIRIYPGRGHHLSGADFDDALRRAFAFLEQHFRSKAA